MKKYRANGKLLLTGEYFVLDGAKSLCLPSSYGQTMEVSFSEETSFLEWKAFLADGSLWFDAKIEVETFQLMESSHSELALYLIKILRAVQELNPHILQNGVKIETRLEFPKDWGLGSSSTLISLLSQWAEVNPYELLEKTFGGSGYDLACAVEDTPIFYTRNHTTPQIEKADFHPSYHEHIYFVYLNQKQNSREGIQLYRKKPKNEDLIKKISELSEQISQAKTLEEFEKGLKAHEEIVSNYLGISQVQHRLFSDYTDGVVKSLGAWGGDFVCVTSRSGDMSYFKEKGYTTIVPYTEMCKTEK